MRNILTRCSKSEIVTPLALPLGLATIHAFQVVTQRANQRLRSSRSERCDNSHVTAAPPCIFLPSAEFDFALHTGVAKNPEDWAGPHLHEFNNAAFKQNPPWTQIRSGTKTPRSPSEGLLGTKSSTGGSSTRSDILESEGEPPLLALPSVRVL